LSLAPFVLPVATMKLALAAIALAACSTDDRIERCANDQVTITRGAYGMLIGGCDVEGCSDRLLVDEQVAAYPPGQGHWTDDTTSGSIAVAHTDQRGIYALALAPGTYDLCTYSCTTVTVTGLDRFDWESGPGGGEWQSDPCPAVTSPGSASG
jgi:hypothetical protein